jgi:hypothetical protein
VKKKEKNQDLKKPEKLHSGQRGNKRDNIKFYLLFLFIILFFNLKFINVNKEVGLNNREMDNEKKNKQ